MRLRETLVLPDNTEAPHTEVRPTAAPQPLILKYRPRDFGEVLGHDAVVSALRRALASETRPHAYLLTGPSGVGKTTIARIIGAELDADVTEIDAASNNGVDDMRELTEQGQYASFQGKGAKLFIVDECHMLTKNAWNAILKLLEEPPPHLYLALCTTELGKIMDTVATRCYHVVLRALKTTEMDDLVALVADLEGWEVTADVLSAVVQAATGQPRKALSMLQAVHDAPTREEAKRVIALVDNSDPLIEVLRHLVEGKKSWIALQRLLARVDDDVFAEAATQAGRYLLTVMLRTTEEKQARMVWKLLDALVFPSETFDRKAAFVAALGRMIWGDG